MFTTDPFSIRAERGMGEFDSSGTYRDRVVEGEPAAAPPGADAAATGEWQRSKNASELRRAVAFFGHRNRGEVPEPFRTVSP